MRLFLFLGILAIIAFANTAFAVVVACGCGGDTCVPCCDLPTSCGDNYGFGLCVPTCANDREACEFGGGAPFPSGFSCPPNTIYLGCSITASDLCACTAQAQITCQFDCSTAGGYPFGIVCNDDGDDPPDPCECPDGFCDPNGLCIIDTCNDDSDCPSGTVCVDGSCQPPCEETNSCPDECEEGEPGCCNDISDCPTGEYCGPNGDCNEIPPCTGPDCEPCTDNGDCPSGEVCQDGICEDQTCGDNCGNPNDPNNPFVCCPNNDNGVCLPKRCTSDRQCDDNNPFTVDVCANPGVCTGECRYEFCGNDRAETGEQCGEPGLSCSANEECRQCQCYPKDPECHDGRRDPGEQCGEPGLSCGPHQECVNCECEDQAYCGDGTINDPSEECEPPGNACGRNGDSVCTSNCKCPETPWCGNGRIDVGEECDPANPMLCYGELACNGDCTCPEPPPECGNGRLDDGESCDLSTGQDDCQDPLLCTANCTCAGHVPRCGDGFQEPPEQCDDGNTNNGDGCSSTCELEDSTTPFCIIETNTLRNRTTATVNYFYFVSKPTGQYLQWGDNSSQELNNSNCYGNPNGECGPFSHIFSSSDSFMLTARVTNGVQTADCNKQVTIPPGELLPTCMVTATPDTHYENGTSQILVKVENAIPTLTTILFDCGDQTTPQTFNRTGNTYAGNCLYANEIGQPFQAGGNNGFDVATDRGTVHCNPDEVRIQYCGNSIVEPAQERCDNSACGVGETCSECNCIPSNNARCEITVDPASVGLNENSLATLTFYNTTPPAAPLLTIRNTRTGSQTTTSTTCNETSCTATIQSNEASVYRVIYDAAISCQDTWIVTPTSSSACGNNQRDPEEECDPSVIPNGCENRANRPICRGPGEQNACTCQGLSRGADLVINAIRIEPLSLQPTQQLESVRVRLQNVGDESCSDAFSRITITDADHLPLANCSGWNCTQRTTSIPVYPVENKTVCFGLTNSECVTNAPGPTFNSSQTGTFGIKVEAYCGNQLQDTKFAFFSVGNPEYTPIPETHEILIILIALAVLGIIYRSK